MPENSPESNRITQPTPTTKAKTKGFFGKMYDAFIKNDIKTVRKGVFYDVIAPNIADLIINSVDRALIMFLKDDARYIPQRGSSGKYHDRYNGGSQVSCSNRVEKPAMMIDIRRFKSSDYTIPDREDAERVRLDLENAMIGYEWVPVAIFFESLDITPPPEAYNWGWNDLRGLSVAPVYGGYIVTLPTIKHIPSFPNDK